MISQEIRKLAPEQDPLRMGMGWTVEDLSKPQIMIESTFGDSHPGSAHLLELVDRAADGVKQAGGRPARYFATDISPIEYMSLCSVAFSLCCITSGDAYRLVAN